MGDDVARSAEYRSSSRAGYAASRTMDEAASLAIRLPDLGIIPLQYDPRNDPQTELGSDQQAATTTSIFEAEPDRQQQMVSGGSRRSFDAAFPHTGTQIEDMRKYRRISPEESNVSALW